MRNRIEKEKEGETNQEREGRDKKGDRVREK